MRSPLHGEIEHLKGLLQGQGVHAALRYLNERTAYRFTGVYRFDGDMLRNVHLYDRWAPEQTQGADAPMGETYCAIVGSLGDGLEVSDGATDARFPWMHSNAVLSYCGAPARDSAGVAIGTLCHFDLLPCQATRSEMPFLTQAAPLMLRASAA